MGSTKRIAIIGGGAAGYFAALSAANEIKKQKKKAQIIIFEGSRNTLRKVRISGGGRCNVTHNQFEIKQFVQSYPRGKRELNSPFQQFQAKDTVAWFEKRGVAIVAEADGRMFPKSNTSQTIIDCFTREANNAGIELIAGNTIRKIEIKESSFILFSDDNQSSTFDQVLIATGSDPKGHQIIRDLGHQITELAPSLFSFKVNHPLLKEMAGTSFKKIELKLEFSDKKKFKQEGPLLITHHGLSGPAILKLSAWAARSFKKDHYKTNLTINWAAIKHNSIEELFENHRKEHGQNLMSNRPLSFFTRKFWALFLAYHKIDPDKKWHELSKKEGRKLVDAIFQTKMPIHGQNRFKDEFVECGGVSLKEIDFKTMESKLYPGLFFAGEVLDIDGITGGFNFQNAWTTGHIAGKNMAAGLNM